MRELRPWIALLMHRRKRLMIGALLMFLTLASAVGLLSLSGWFITATAITGLIWATGTRFVFDVYVPGGGIRFFALARTVTRYLERVYNHDTVLRLLADLRGSHFSALTRLDGATLARWRASQWLNRLTADIDTLDTLYLRLMAPPVVALLGILLVGLLIAVFHASLAAILVTLLLALLFTLTVGMAVWCQRLSARRVERLDKLRSQSVELLQGLAELSAAGSLTWHQQRLLAASRAMLNEQQALQWRVALGQGLATLGVSGIMLAGLYGGMQAYQQELLSGPAVVLIVLALMAMSEGMASLPAAFAQTGATRAAAGRLNQQTVLRSRLAESIEALPVPALHTLEWRGVQVGYTRLPPINLHLAAGERLAIIGPSGCGKSTLAALAARLIDPDAGDVLAGGVTLRQFQLDEWRTQFGYLTQQTELLHDSVAANLLLARPDASGAELWEALELVELADTVESFPAKLATWVGESGRQLSGGQARRLALARVVLKNPPLVILDEPFSGLDEPTRRRIQANLDPWLAGRSVLMLGHDPNALPGADRVLSWDQVLAL
ncbi:hypothetical protein LCGC14_0201730 [marine sediment metagenome]